MSSAKNRASAGRGATSKLGRGTKRNLDRAGQAQRGAELEFVRTAGPRAIAQMLARLEAKGEIVATNDVSASAEDFDLDEAADVEINMEDEDLAPVEVWQNAGRGEMDSVVLGNKADPEEPWSDGDMYELVIHDGICTFQNPEWMCAYDPVNQRFINQSDELANRCRVFRGLADWLTTARPAFLKSRDLWDIGPASIEETVQGCSILQKELLESLALNPPVSEASFSRFMTQCELVWHDGAAPVQILFSKEAGQAWVARAVVMFAKKYPGRSLGERLEQFKHTKVSKTRLGHASLAITKLGSITLETFLQLVNQKAGTSWEQVLIQYKSRMLSEYSHAKK